MRWPLLAGWLLCGCAQSVELLPPSDGGASAESALGAPCTGTCAGGLTCYTTADPTHAFADGYCSKPCVAASDCPSPNATCGTVELTTLCLAACDSSRGLGCRVGYDCCPDHQAPTTGPGACAIRGSNYCGG